MLKAEEQLFLAGVDPLQNQNFNVRKRDGRVVPFDDARILIAIESAFRQVHGLGQDTVLSEVLRSQADEVAQRVVDKVLAHAVRGDDLEIEKIQDTVETTLMECGHHAIARSYIIYREDRRKARALRGDKSLDGAPQARLHIVLRDGTRDLLDPQYVRRRVMKACRGLEDRCSWADIADETLAGLYDGVPVAELDRAIIMAARARVEREPGYSYVAARLLLDTIYAEVLGIDLRFDSPVQAQREKFRHYIEYGAEVKRLSPDLQKFDLARIAAALHPERDALYQYLGIQTVYDRYLLSHQGRRIETPQWFLMRVAMGLASNEGEQKEARAIEFYHLLSTFRFVSSTPTLFNSGTLHPQLSSCYLSTVMDDLDHIFKVVSDDAKLSKWAGGLGNDWSNIRGTGAHIRGTNGESQGVVPFLKVANDTAVAVNQCFAPDTLVHTAKGLLPLADVHPGDLVLGKDGEYRPVTQHFVYGQKDRMVEIRVKHSVQPIRVTAGHPFHAIPGVPAEQSIERTLAQIQSGKFIPQWIDAGQLRPNDYAAQVIPQEIVHVPGLTPDDARLYGILLGDGHVTKGDYEWGVSGHPGESSLAFVRQYLAARDIHFWENQQGETYTQVKWSSGKGLARDAATGQLRGAGQSHLPFSIEDIYTASGEKHIAPRLAHLPRQHTLQLVRGLLETDGNLSRGKEITFTNTSVNLIEGLRYQLLRLGVPSSGKTRLRQMDHLIHRPDGTDYHMKGEVNACDLRVPATPEIAALVGARPLTKQNWFVLNGHIFSRIRSVKEIPVLPEVHDLEVEGVHSYMTTSALVHNGGKRKGAMCAYLETWHLDIEDFIELRKNTGDERRRTHDMNTANWIPDLFMKRVIAGQHWTLFSPDEVPDLHDLYGAAFETRYHHYENLAAQGKIRLHRQVEALVLWRKMISMLFETGHPWMTFKDPSNLRSPQSHAGVVHSSNLCTEILLNTSVDEIAVCNLGSINLARHITPDRGLDRELLADTVRTAMRMLDNVIDINYYPIPEARNANLRHRPVGLGFMGFQDALHALRIPYASQEAVEFADESMELISYHALLASAHLARERGPYATYQGSKWSQGLLPIDTVALLQNERGGHLDMDTSSKLDWTPVRQAIAAHGMRNSNCMAIAPTATISNISGVSQSIEPTFRHLYAKSNLSGEFTSLNSYLVEDLKTLGLWDEDMLAMLKYHDGQLARIDRIPDDLKLIYLTAFEIEPFWLIECASRRQKWIDMGQSLNLYMESPNGRKLHEMYLLAWRKGLKTTYYLRTVAATQIEKSTLDVNKFGIQPRWMKNKSASSNVAVPRQDTPAPTPPATEVQACSIDNPDCESCQ